MSRFLTIRIGNRKSDTSGRRVDRGTPSGSGLSILCARFEKKNGCIMAWCCTSVRNQICTLSVTVREIFVQFYRTMYMCQHKNDCSCIPDKDIHVFSLDRQFLSHPCYLTQGLIKITCIFKMHCLYRKSRIYVVK